MSEITTSGIEPSDLLGGAMFAVGVAVLMEKVPMIETPIAGIVLMVFGIGAVYGRGTFAELVKEILLSTEKLDGGDESDETGDGEDDGEVGIDRPPGDEVTASK